MWLLKSRMTLVFITPDPFTQVKTRNFSRRVFSRISGISSVSSIKFCFRRHPYKQPVTVPSYLYEKNPYAKIHSVSMDSFSFTSRILHLPFRYPDRSEWYLPEQCADYPEAVPIPSSVSTAFRRVCCISGVNTGFMRLQQIWMILPKIF